MEEYEISMLLYDFGNVIPGNVAETISESYLISVGLFGKRITDLALR